MSNISQIQVNNTTYDIKDAVARDEKINKSEIADPYDSTKTYSNGDIFEYNGELFQVINEYSMNVETYAGLEKVEIANTFKQCQTTTQELLSVLFVNSNTFVSTTDDNEKIWFNTVSISEPVKNRDNKYTFLLFRTTPNAIDGVRQYGLIVARNDLTGIDSIDDANELLKVQKVDDEYIATYANSQVSATTTQGNSRRQASSLKQGTSPIGYVRGYAVFKNDDNTETVMYTPCKLLSWEETQS